MRGMVKEMVVQMRNRKSNMESIINSEQKDALEIEVFEYVQVIIYTLGFLSLFGI